MKKSNFLEGAVFATLAIIITKVIGVLYVIPFYRMVGTQGGALYGYAYNIYNLFLIISSAGIPLAISKLTSEIIALKQDNKKEYMFSIAQKSLFSFSVVCFLLCFCFANQIAYFIVGDLNGANSLKDVAFVLRCVSFALLIVPNLSINRGYLQGHKYIQVASFSQVLEQFIRIIVILLGSFLVLYVFHSSIRNAVGVAVLGAAVSAFVTYIYLAYRKSKIKKAPVTQELTKEEKKEVRKKIIHYCIPFVIISVANHLYNTTDMILLIKGLKMVGFSGIDIETISGIFTTWGNKLISIVTAISTGLVISLIPHVVSSYTLKKTNEVNRYFNKALRMLLFVVLPIALLTSIFAKEIWSIFYSANKFGPIIMKYFFIVAFIDGAFTVMCSTLNSLNKFKFIYLVVLIGLGLNALLDVPLILLFNKLGIYPYYGALTATVIGYSISIILALIYLKKKLNFNYHSTFRLLPRLSFNLIIVIALGIIVEKHLIITSNKLLLIANLAFVNILIIIVYYFLNRKLVNELIKRN